MVIKEVTQLNYYELLNIEPNVSKVEIQRAYYLSLKTYGAESVAVYGLIDDEERERIRKRIEEAYHILMDDQKRKIYDEKISSGSPISCTEIEDIVKEKKNNGELEEIIGEEEVKEDVSAPDFLKRIRERKGIILQDISDATKINITTLSALEKGEYNKLPVRVYTLGYLKSYAEYINMDYKKARENFDILSKMKG
ncbi:MAG: helix-turn-helix domain-containing protein [bacterium]